VLAASDARALRPPKCLIFSQFDDALTIAELALRRNGISCLRLSAAKRAGEVLEQFSSDAGVAALLMPFRSGAEGLNITCASHVFLLDALLDPALEQQAVGRVHRLGQERPCFVHRLVVADTVEQTVSAVARAKLEQRALARRPSAGADAGAGAARSLDEALLELAAQQRPPAAGADEGGDGAADTADADGADGVTRAEVLRLFDAERDFERELEQLGLARDAPVRGEDRLLARSRLHARVQHVGRPGAL
jgi:superfamily II DNA or RNA helicase